MHAQSMVDTNGKIAASILVAPLTTVSLDTEDNHLDVGMVVMILVMANLVVMVVITDVALLDAAMVDTTTINNIIRATQLTVKTTLK